ncbi:MAG: putative Ig domain-containing protein [Gemmatales bacterium]
MSFSTSFRTALRQSPLRTNPDNLRGKAPKAFFSVPSANPDAFGHQKWFNFKSFGFEDLYGGGDRDFNDLVVRFTMDNPKGPVTPPETNAPVIVAGLRTDTAPGGATNTDGISSLVDIQGTVTDQSRITSFRAGLDNTIESQFVNITARLNSNGTFLLDRTLLNQLAGGTLTEGAHTLKLLANDQYNNKSSIYSLPFVLDSQIALSVDLSASADTAPVGDLKTSISTVTLTGITDPGATVQLVGTANSTTADSQGHYSLNGIDLVVGDNTFSLKAIDIAGNERTTSITITYEPGQGGFDDDLTGWRVEELGGTVSGKGTVTVNAGFASIHEGDSYLVSLSKEFVPGAVPSRLDIFFSAPQFDTSAGNKLRDAFEVAYVDADGQTLVLPFSVTRDAYYNATEGQAEQVAIGASKTSGLISVNLSGLPAGAAGRLYLRLFNNDGDTQSQVTIQSVAMVADSTLTPPSGTVASALLSSPTPIAIDVSTLTDVSTAILGEYGRSSYFAGTSTLYSILALRNAGSYGIGGPAIVVIDHLSDPTVVPQGVDGVLPDGRVYFNFTAFLNNDKLVPGAVSGMRALQFYTPSGKPFTYSITVLAQSNRAPAFTTEALPDIAPGRTYLYNALAVDPDGDVVQYQLLAGPSGMAVDPATGKVAWTPAAGQVGNHDVILEASDGRGGSTTQRFTISVRTDIPNRPPVITSAPVVDAYVNTVGPLAQVNLTNWTLQQYNIGQQGNANWVQSADHFSVTQQNNADPSILLSDFNVTNEHIDGTWRGSSADSDNDFFGFVFGYQDSGHFYLFDWKQGTQTDNGMFAEQGMSVKKFSADTPFTQADFWPTSGNGTRVQSLFHNTTSWQKNTDYQFSLDFHAGEIRIVVKQGATVLATIQLNDSTYADGKFGFYNYSQGQVTYSGFSRHTVEGRPYEYDVEGFDPDFDPVSYQLTQAPAGMSIHPTTGEINWRPLALGEYPVTVTASDGRGGTATQNFTIIVRNPPENSPPLFISELPLGTVAGRTFLHHAQALDPDEDALAYSVVSGPNGLAINPDTGVMTWNTTGFAAGTYPVVIKVADGRGGEDTQSFQLQLAAQGGTISGTNYEDISWQGSVPGTANPWLAGMPDGSTALNTDVAPAQSPVRSGLSITPGQVLTFTATGLSSNLPTGGFGPDGDVFVFHSGENGIGDTVIPLSALVGVFLNDDRPNTTGIPASLNFSPGGNVPGGVNYSSLSPLLKQPFFIGDGRTSGGLAQQIVVPSGATRLFLGTLDGVDWNNNSGSLAVTVTTVEPLPSILLTESTFSPATWTFAQGPVYDGNPSLSGPNVVTLEHRTTGGNPSDYQFDQYFFRVGDFVSIVGSSSSMAYNPQTQGAINSIDASIDITQFHVEEPGQFAAGSVWKIMIEQNGVRYYDKQLRVALNNFGTWPTFSVSGLQEQDFDTNVMVGFTGGTIPADPTGLHPDFSASGAPITFGIVDCNAGSGPTGAPLGGAVGFDNYTVTINRLKPKDGMAGWVIYLDQNNNGARDPGERYQITDGQGHYQFTDLPQGTYIVREEAQPIASQSYSYTDGDFIDANWDDATIFLRDGNPGLSGPSVNGPFFSSAGGNPGSYRFQGDDFRVGDLIGTRSINTAISYNPQVQGAIGTIDFAMDAIQFPPVLPGQGSGGTAYTPALMQNGIVYFGTPFGNTSTTWKNYTVTGMTADEFDSEIIPEERLGNHPDFSANGATIFLGYGHWITGHGSTGFQLLNEFGADNMDFTIHNIGQTGLWEQTIPTNPDYYSVDLAEGELESGKDFGNRRKADAGPAFTSEPVTVATVNKLYRYNVEAAGADGVQFDLPQKPAGMVIDPMTGAIVWRPGEVQEGTQTVVVRVRDGHNRVALQSFTINVGQGNSAPVFTSEPTLQAVIGRPWQYRATGSDAENSALVFSLNQGPTGLSISPEGVVNWTPTAGQLGNHSVQLRVSDGQGGEAIQLFTLNVVASAPNTDPVITGSPRTSTRVGDLYLAQLNAHDADGDPLTFSLPTAPAGMSIDYDGKIHFVPVSSQLGAHQVTVRVEDGQGGSTETTFTLNVVGQETNHTPVITSAAPSSATMGRLLRYSPTFTDDDGDPVIWSLLSGPTGLAVDPLTGAVTWSPRVDQLGVHTVVIQAMDPKLAIATQTFTLNVRGSNTPPVILSSAVTEAAVSQAYEYRVRAQDAEGDVLTYALPIAPVGMIIDSATGIISWTPSTGQVGSFSVQVTASDGQGGVATQDFTVIVSGTARNRPPVITSLPNLKASVDRPYQYQVAATDPEGDTLLYALLSGPVGMGIDTNTGLVTWTPTPAQLGSHLVTIGARDSAGVYGQQTFRITVIENQAPVITSLPATTGLTGTLYRYDVGANDPDGDTLTYSLVQFQAGMTIDQSGRISWNVPLAQGTVQIAVNVADSRGGVAEQTFNITIIGDTEAPQVNAQINPNPAVIGNDVQIRVNATDNNNVASIVLTIDGTVIPLAADGKAHFDAVAAGNFSVQVTAFDAAGNQGTYTTNIVVVDEEDPTGMGPYILISSPTTDASITTLTDIVGSITSLDGVANWSISIAPYGTTNFRQIATGTGAVTNATLGSFDPTTIANDQYIIRVIARDSLNRSSKLDLNVNVQGGLKLGRVVESFTDLLATLFGHHVQVTRTYDSLLTNQSGDFGYGWQLSIQDPHIHETVASNIGQGIFGPVSAPFKVGTKVYLTTPEGKRVGFTFNVDPVDILFFGTYYRPKFIPDPGVNEKLDVLSQPSNPYGDLLVKLPDGTFTQPFAIFGGRFNPDVYHLTTKDGTVYSYDQTQGLQSITEPSGEVITFSKAGIVSSEGTSVVYQRDVAGRITSVIDPVGNEIVYQYDMQGRLISVTDQEGATTSYSYLSGSSNSLSTITDSLGHRILTLEYDSNGRLVASKDALGNTASTAYDMSHLLEHTTNAVGGVSTLLYDEQGNLLSITDPLGAVTQYQYDQNNNIIKEIDPMGGTTTKTYDDRGNVLTSTTAAGTSYASYDEGNNVTSLIDQLGRIWTSVYDLQGNLLRLINPIGEVNQFIYEDGKISASIDPDGYTTQFEYTVGEHPSTVRFPDGTVRKFEYNLYGQVTKMVDELGKVTSYDYDGAAHLLRMIDSNGGVYSYAYQDDLLVSETDQLGNVTRYEYDDAGRRVRIIDAKGKITRLGYDQAGNLTSTTDSLNQTTAYEYDLDNQLIRQLDPFNYQTSYSYDLNGNPIQAIDRNGHKFTFKYDSLNQLLEEQWWNGVTSIQDIQYSYDAVGNMLSIHDSASNYVYTYDNLDRVVTVNNAGTPHVPNMVLSYQYDHRDNLIQVTDNYGVAVDSTYNSRNRLTSRSWQGTGIDQARIDFTYDAIGDVTDVKRYRDIAGQLLVGRSQYTYDSLGLPLDIVHRNASDAVFAEYSYSYNHANQVTHAYSLTSSLDYTYDPLGQLIGVTGTGQGAESYQYDSAGNRESSTNHPGYTIGNNNQIVSDGTFEYTYDRESNLTSKREITTGTVTTYSYDYRNRLTVAEQRASNGVLLTKVEFTYDAFNRRIAKSVNGITTYFVYDGDNVWADLDNTGSIEARYLYGDAPDQLLARSRSVDGASWYLADGNGNVRDIAGSAGQLIDHIDYDSFGNILHQTNSSVADRYLFTSREYDAELGLYYYRARYYDPSIGRFLSEDPKGIAAGDFNLYRYVGNSPHNYTDPSGEQAIVEYRQYLWPMRTLLLRCAEQALASFGTSAVIDVTIYVLEVGPAIGPPQPYVGRTIQKFERRFYQHAKAGKQLRSAVPLVTKVRIPAGYLQQFEQQAIDLAKHLNQGGKLANKIRAAKSVSNPCAAIDSFIASTPF